MKYHMTAFFLGFLLDLLFGDPYWLPHPIRLIGSLIARLETCLLGSKKEREPDSERKPDRTQDTDSEREPDRTRNAKKEFRRGVLLVIVVLVCTAAAASILLFLAYRIHPCAGTAVEAVMTYRILAAKCLKVESMKVYNCLKSGTLEEARRAVSMIVGRDTACLDGEGVAKAAVETVAENTSDGVIAPMLYTVLFGPVGGFLYKAVNTMDSMIGYKNDRYLYFGRAAAKLDDALNYLPARISAYLMIAAAFLGGRQFSGTGAYRIYKRDRRKHASPNSAQTEAVCAGALGVRLAGDASYFGKTVKKPYIGDALRCVEAEDIRRADRLMYLTAWFGEILCLVVMLVVYERMAV